MIVVFHLLGTTVDPFSSRLWAGVPLFFVISGYCIAASVESTHRQGRSVWDYIARRLRRILPPYGAALLLTYLVLAPIAAREPAWFHASVRGLPPLRAPQEVTVWAALSSVTLSAAWVQHLPLVWRGADGWLLGQAWTLGYEEQFYLVCGLCLLVGAQAWGRWAAGVTLAVMALVVVVPRIALAGFFYDGRWLLFAFGLGVYAMRTTFRWWFPARRLRPVGGDASRIAVARGGAHRRSLRQPPCGISAV
jgi:peptidoglycan/LPS O-acetylase OafA/YrhL